MKIVILSLLVCFLSYGIEGDIAELKIKKDEVKIEFEFVSDHAKGSLTGFNASIKFDAENLELSEMTGTVDVATLSTGEAERDSHLKGPTVFNAKDYPQMTFRSTAIDNSEEGFNVTGFLKIKDVEKEVEIDFKYAEQLLNGTSTIYSEDWDIMKGNTREDSKVLIVFHIPLH